MSADYLNKYILRNAMEVIKLFNLEIVNFDDKMEEFRDK